MSVYEYLPFRTGASSDAADCTLWASMSNVELVAPTVPFAQSGVWQAQSGVTGYGLGPVLERVDQRLGDLELLPNYFSPCSNTGVNVSRDGGDRRLCLSGLTSNVDGKVSLLTRDGSGNTIGVGINIAADDLFERNDRVATRPWVLGLNVVTYRSVVNYDSVGSSVNVGPMSFVWEDTGSGEIDTLVATNNPTQGIPPVSLEVYPRTHVPCVIEKAITGSQDATRFRFFDTSTGSYHKGDVWVVFTGPALEAQSGFWEAQSGLTGYGIGPVFESIDARVGSLEDGAPDIESRLSALEANSPSQGVEVINGGDASFDFTLRGVDFTYSTISDHVRVLNGVPPLRLVYAFSVNSNDFITASSQEPLTFPVLGTTGQTTRVGVIEFPRAQSGVWEAQSGRKGRSNATSVEKGSDESGPISSLLRRVSHVATLAGGIPTLGAFAGPTAWATNLAANVAGVFGWSKPLNTSLIARRLVTKNVYQSNCEGVDPAFNLGLLPDAQVRALPGFGGTDVDEMCIDFLKGVPYYITTFSFNSLSDHGTALMSIPLKPIAMLKHDNPIVSDSYLPTNNSIYSTGPLMALGECFEYWRGGFVFTFKMAKTQFHSGRLMFSFMPSFEAKANGDVVNESIDDSIYLHREVVDLREVNEFSFHVPFTSLVPYLRSSECFGHVRCWIVHDLKHPETTSDVVDVAVEVHAASDFEFSVPREPAFFYAQSGGDLVAGTKNFESILFSELCVGEKIKSTKQLMMRAVRVANDYVNHPFQIETNPANRRPDYFSIFGAMYAFSRGGVILRTISEGPIKLALDIRGDGEVSDFSPFVVEEKTSIASVYLPQYMRVHGRLNGHVKEGVTTYVESCDERYRPRVRLTVDTDSAYALYRSAAEDTQFAYFLGVPRIRWRPGGGVLEVA